MALYLAFELATNVHTSVAGAGNLGAAFGILAFDTGHVHFTINSGS